MVWYHDYGLHKQPIDSIWRLIRTLLDTSNTCPDDLLLVDDVAAIARCSRRTVLNRLATGELPYCRLGPRLFRIRRSDLESWLAGRVVDTDDVGQRTTKGPR
jgi:excisionase family DNA binding protein